MGVSNVNADLLETDLAIVGGGGAGLMAAMVAREQYPGLRVTVLEKADVRRSGCLAMGLNAINLYLGKSSPEAYADYVAKDNYGVVRRDLLVQMGGRVNAMTERLVDLGVPFPRENGDFVYRSKRSIAMHGERLKPLLAKGAVTAGAEIRNHTPVYDLLVNDVGECTGVLALDLRAQRPLIVRAKATILATGGASGIYRPSSPGTARKKTWYCPYNAGGGLAMGIRAGAEMTSFEMRFVALRTKDVIAPTGTLAFTRRVCQRNSKGDAYIKLKQEMIGRPLTTAERLSATVEENRIGSGPCQMDLSALSAAEYDNLMASYLEMAPGIVLLMSEQSATTVRRIEVVGSEPYVNGGHGMAGFWVDGNRQTTIPRLYAAGDIAGGVPKKYLTGCFAEAEIAVHHAATLPAAPVASVPASQCAELVRDLVAPLARPAGLSPYEIEERLQKLMDEYAGGASVFYESSAAKLAIATTLLEGVEQSLHRVGAGSWADLMDANDMRDRITVARVLVQHLQARRETRWPCYQSRADFPVRNDVEYRCFVNSVMTDGRIQCFARDLDPPFQSRELP